MKTCKEDAYTSNPYVAPTNITDTLHPHLPLGHTDPIARDGISSIPILPKWPYQEDSKSLNDLMAQHMAETLTSGRAFLDSSDHISKGFRLYKWADSMIEAIRTTRVHAGTTKTSSSSIGEHLEGLDSVILDEHAQLLGTLLWVWKNMAQMEDDESISKIMISQVRNNSDQDVDPVIRNTFINYVASRCLEILGFRHALTKIFFCMKQSSVDLNDCLEHLELLPAQVFGTTCSSPSPSSEKDETSDYHTVGSGSHQTLARSRSRITLNRDVYTKERRFCGHPRRK